PVRHHLDDALHVRGSSGPLRLGWPRSGARVKRPGSMVIGFTASPALLGSAMALALAGCSTPQSTLRVIAVRRAADAAPEVGRAPAPALLLEWPVKGEVSSLFGPRDGRAHDGIDIAVPDGTVVVAAHAGLVRYAGAVRGYGNLILLEHPGGWVTVYAHNSEVRVREGQLVRRGELIALSG